MMPASGATRLKQERHIGIYVPVTATFTVRFPHVPKEIAMIADTGPAQLAVVVR
jgi:hypothetical protein